jgi:hypothetical protein
MKIRVEFTVEVDEEKWQAEYREDHTANEIREMVRGSAHDATLAWLEKAKTLHFAYAEDMAGLWLYLTDGENYQLVNDRPIVREPTRSKIKSACEDCRPRLEKMGGQ